MCLLTFNRVCTYRCTSWSNFTFFTRIEAQYKLGHMHLLRKPRLRSRAVLGPRTRLSACSARTSAGVKVPTLFSMRWTRSPLSKPLEYRSRQSFLTRFAGRRPSGSWGLLFLLNIVPLRTMSCKNLRTKCLLLASSRYNGIRCIINNNVSNRLCSTF